MFFLSYARTHAEGSLTVMPQPGFDERVLTFYNDLCDHVRQLVGSRTGSLPGFIDQSMTGGQKGDQRILEMVRTAPVFVALISADYVDSAYCGEEWDIFSRRRPTRRDGRPTGDETTVLPVVWSTVPDARLPDVIKEVQRFAPDFRSDAALHRAYIDHGIYGLIAGGRTYTSYYEAVVWQLARSVAKLFHTFEVPDGIHLTRDDLRNVFDDEEDV